jgi:carboxyl-terminal processing protease
MKTFTLAIVLAGVILLSSCEKTILNPEYEDNAVDNFECLWHNYDLNYGQFLVRKINWDSLHTVYRAQINEQSGTDELYDVFKSLIVNFHDDHVFIDPTEPGYARIESGRSDTMKIQTDFSIDQIKEHYLVSSTQYSEHILYGLLPDNIGYIQMDVFADPLSFIQKAFDDILKQLKDTRALVFDIRQLEGGEDRLAKFIAGRFSSETRLFMTTRKRNGPRHDDFESPVSWYVNPEGSSQYIKPVMLMTGRFTASAGETFTWAMRENANVLQVGDTTLGAFSDIMVMELPNGWLHTVPVGDYRNSSGENLEGTGIAPDYYARSTKDETLAGIDRGLDKALELLQY